MGESVIEGREDPGRRGSLEHDIAVQDAYRYKGAQKKKRLKLEGGKIYHRRKFKDPKTPLMLQ